MIYYSESLHGITPAKLRGFAADWRVAPSSEQMFRMLRSSHSVALAIDDEEDRVVGYAAALSDGCMFAFISSIEVLPDYQGRGIGKELMNRMMARYRKLYALDLLCDADKAGFYEQFGMQQVCGMARRNYDGAKAA
jgi:ribosomal protein S18 acetylase RimI-like enzyme